MASISRRMFLKRGGTGVAAAGLLAAIPPFPRAPGLRAGRRRSTATASPHPAGRGASGPLVVHIPDPRTGEVHLMVGSREVIRKDSALVARLVREAG